MSSSYSSTQPGRSPDWVRAAVWVGAFLVILYVQEGIDQLIFDDGLDSRGIVPRTDEGLVGVALAPLLHVEFSHLIANTIPIAVFGYLVLASGVARGLLVTAVIWVVSGLGVWLFSPTLSVTLGASGLIFGWLVYLLVRGAFTRSAWEIILGLTLFFLYGGVLLGVLPGEEGISWQAHLFGAVGGLIAAMTLAERSTARAVASYR